MFKVFVYVLYLLCLVSVTLDIILINKYLDLKHQLNETDLLVSALNAKVQLNDSTLHELYYIVSARTDSIFREEYLIDSTK